MVLGTLVGLPALRLSGLYLALITLMLARRDHRSCCATTNFPNGGPGFLGHTESSLGNAGACAAPTSRSPTRRTSATRSSSACSCSCSRCWHVRAQARAGLGGDPPERAGGARGRREHHALQAVGVRAGVVHDRRGRRAAGRRASASSTRTSSRRRTRSLLLAVGADGRHLQPVGRGRRRACS